MPQTILLALEGLSCDRCVRHVKEALEQRDDVRHAEVSTSFATINTGASVDELIATIKQAGYYATLAQSTLPPKDKPLAESKQQPDALVAVSQQHLAYSNNTFYLLIDGMHCASCVSHVQKVLQQVPGVQQVRVNLAERSAVISGDALPLALTEAVRDAGYGAEIITDEGERREKQQKTAVQTMRRFRWQSILALALGIPLMVWGMAGDNMMLTAANRFGWLAVGIVTLVVIIVAGGHFYRNAARSLCHGTATMDTLVTLGTGAAWIYSTLVVLWPAMFPTEARHLYYEASVMIIGLINLGHMLEQRARQRASRALVHLLDLTPPIATVITESGEEKYDLNKVMPGMTLRLRSGDRIPVDGTVLQGDALIDEAMLSGEAMPQQKTSGDKIQAGTVVLDGSLLFTAQAVGKNTTLSRIISRVREAQSSKPEMGRLADRLSAVFVPVVMAIAVFSAALWFAIGPAPQMIYALIAATTVLIIACPCALGLATPVSIIAGVGRAAEYGVLVRDAEALQRASTLSTLVFDKTGTLTTGDPQVIDITLFGNISEQQVLRWAAALEEGSSHPLAKAIRKHAGEIALPQVMQFRTLRGLGVSGKVDNITLWLGNSTLMAQQKISTTVADAAINAAASLGITPVLLAAGGEVIALFSVRDPLRDDSVAVLKRLRERGYEIVMLTGDNALTANAIAHEAGIARVVADVLPEGKAGVISALQQQGKKVAMIGDGINDAPALAQADVGIALSSGSDIAIETAAMTLMRHDLNTVPDALAIASATLRNMKQNLAGAFIYNIIAIPLAAGALYPLTGALLSPVIAGAAMALSSVTVVSNANRLTRYQPD